MRTKLTIFLTSAAAAATVYAASVDGWPRWRGPKDDGMAAGDAPLHWSDTEHIAWKVTVPGKGNSSPVAWGDRIFLTTAVPSGAAPSLSAEPGGAATGTRLGGRRGGFGGPGGPSGPQAEQKLM